MLMPELLDSPPAYVSDHLDAVTLDPSMSTTY